MARATPREPAVILTGQFDVAGTVHVLGQVAFMFDPYGPLDVRCCGLATEKASSTTKGR